MPPASLDEKWQAFEEEAGPRLADEVSTQAPVETGWLADNQNWRDSGDGVLEVYETDNRGPVPVWVIRGTSGPYPIDPVTATVLHWIDRSTGEDVFARHVDHPGILPNRYNIRAWQMARGDVLTMFARNVGLGYVLAVLNPFTRNPL